MSIQLVAFRTLPPVGITLERFNEFPMTDLTKNKHQSVTALLSDLRNRSRGKTERQTIQTTLQLANGAMPLSITCSVSLATAVPITAHNKTISSEYTRQDLTL